MSLLSELNNNNNNNNNNNSKTNVTTIINDLDVTNKYSLTNSDIDLYDNYITEHNINNDENRVMQQKYHINIDSSIRNKNRIKKYQGIKQWIRSPLRF